MKQKNTKNTSLYILKNLTMMKKPFILTNCKNYQTAVGENAKKLVEEHINARKNTEQNFAVAINTLDIAEIAKLYAVRIPLFAQHCDDASYGSSTGKILPEYLRELGVAGVILNHSENRFSDFTILKNTVENAKNCGLTVVLCAESAEEGTKFSSETNADFIAVEPPELIGGDISVSTAQPELITQSVEAIGGEKLLVGAGIKNGSDVAIAVKNGASGVLLASGVTKSSDPYSVLLDLVSQV
jgi:triosephosphate isomerase